MEVIYRTSAAINKSTKPIIMHTPITFTICAIILAITPLIAIPVRGAETATKKENLLALRDLPPVLLNSDGTDLDAAAHLGDHPFYSNLPAIGHLPPTAQINSLEDYLALRIGPMAESALLGLSNGGNWNDPVWEIKRDRLKALGDDPYKTICDFWKKEPNRRFYFNMRMNDGHHQWLNIPGLWTERRKNNRHLFMNPPSEKEWSEEILPWIEQRGPSPEIIKQMSARNDWLYDYAKPEVRSHYLAVIREALERYDVDGIELDFNRYPAFFKKGEVDAPVMTDFMRQVHGIVKQAALEKEKPKKLLIRVPESPRHALGIGLDVEEWVRQGWIDAVIVGQGWIFSNNPLAPWLEITRPNQVPVYGAIERVPQYPNRYFVRFATPEGLRAAASMLKENGADGIYFFNLISPAEMDIISEIQEPGKLASLPKEYFADGGHLSDLPAQLAGGGRVTLPLVIGDDPSDAESLRLEVVWDGENEAEAPVVSINGDPQANFERQDTEHWPDIYEAPNEHRGTKPANRFTIATADTESIRKSLQRGNNTVDIQAREPSKIQSVSLRFVPKQK